MMGHQNSMASWNSFSNSMESSQWMKLPRDLQILVVTKLPLLEIRRLSLSCKHFHSLLSDPSFAIQYDRNAVGRPALFIFPDLFEKIMSLPVLNSVIWHQGRHVTFSWKNPLPYDLRRSSWDLSCYGDGFMCFKTVAAPYLFLVLNLLFPHHYKILSIPDIADYRRVFYTGIAYDRKKQLCKLVLFYKNKTQEFDCGITSFVYNFQEGAWKKLRDCNRIPRYSYSFQCDAPFILHEERFLCWLVVSRDNSNMVLMFDVEEESWTKPISVPSTLMSGECKSFLSTIAEHRKQLCVIYGNPNTMILELCKFDKRKSVWIRSEVIPLPPLPVCQINYFREGISGGREFLSFRDFDAAASSSSSYEIINNLWVYDMLHRTWQSTSTFEFPYYFEATLFR